MFQWLQCTPSKSCSQPFPPCSALCPSAGKLLLGCGCESPNVLRARARSPVLPLGRCSFHPELVFRVIFSDVPPSLPLLLLTCVRGGASQELLFTAPPTAPR